MCEKQACNVPLECAAERTGFTSLVKAISDLGPGDALAAQALGAISAVRRLPSSCFIM